MSRPGSGLPAPASGVQVPGARGVWLAVVVGLALLASAARAGQEQGPDVIVVGAGPGGLATALEAAQGGARVTVIDAASVFGGHAVVSEGGLSFAGTPLQRARQIEDSPDLMFGDIVRLGGDAHAGWARLFADRGIPDIHDWLVSLGVTFTSLQRLNGNSVPRFHENPKRGFGVVEPIYRRCLQTGVEFVWNVRVSRLLVETGRVAGVEGQHERTGAVRQWRAPSVVLATGGFQSNLALVRAHWPPDVAVPARILIGAGVNAHGTGLELARGAGAVTERLDHQWNYPRGIVDPRYPDAGRGLNVVFGTRFAWLNARGERIWAEKVEDMLAQPDGRVLVIFDREGRADFRVSGADWADRRRVEALLDDPAIARQAGSIEALARAAGLPADAVARTIERWNAMVASGEDRELDLFSRSKGTFASPTGVQPRPIAVPPFHAVEVWPLTRKSMGGVAIDMTCRALDAGGRPISGLYAVGEVAGFGGLNGRATIEGAFIAPAMLQGRIAGRAIAAALGRRPRTASAMPVRRAAPAGPVAPCTTCHAMDRLLASPRKGYWHFERVHRLVAERTLACVRCHAEMSPFRPGDHRIDRAAQIDSCGTCHLPRR
jgi:succinate dehydrogenase/fumarate reductase flavoprotein subunit